MWVEVDLDGQTAGQGTGSGKKNSDTFSYYFTARSQVYPVLRKTGTLQSEGQKRIRFRSLCSIPRTASAH